MTYIRTATEEVLVWKLQYIKDHDYELPEGQTPLRVVQEILDILGSPDPELRDTLGYTVLAHLLTDQNKLTSEELRQVLARVLSEEMLFWELGESGTDSVFLRSFSSLALALVLIRDNQHEAFLTADEVHDVVDRLVTYCQREADLRGYVPGSGWAHAPAHAADAIDECIRNRHTDAANCERLWQGLRALVLHAEETFGFEEDERISVALTAMVEMGKVPLATICEWLEQEQVQIAGSTAYHARIQGTNWKHLTRSLYFRLRKMELLGEQEARLVALQDSFTRF
ncbi:MAG: DUF2785 domain-containing protein [Tumebacillaceae bacterium]